MWVRARWLAGTVTMLALAALQLAGSAMPAGVALGPNEALVCSDGTGGVVSVLDLTTGRLREIASAPVAAIPPMVLPGRQSFAYWQGGDSSPYTLWLVTLPDTRKRLYTAPEGYKPIAATWWQAHYCVLTAMHMGERGQEGRLLLVTPQGASREVGAWLDHGAGDGPLPLRCQVVLGLGDGQHALACSVGQAVRAVVEMNSGRGVFLNQGWERQETLAWPSQANLTLQNPHLNPVDGRIYATLCSFVWIEARTPELREDFYRRLAQASGIYSFKPDGSDLRRVGLPPSMGIGTYRFPVLVDLSPDGRRMLYAYHDYGVKGHTVPGLYICGLDGSASGPVPGEGAKLSTAAWGS